MRPVATPLVVTLLLLATGCRPDPLKTTESSLRIAPASLDFGTVFASGKAHTLTFDVVNDGRNRLPLEWKSLEAPFELIDPPAEIPSGSNQVTVRFTPTVAAHYSRQLSVGTAGLPTLLMPIDAIASPIPGCTPSSSCVDAVFDLDTESCVETVKADGTTCSPGTVCILEGTCSQGRCVGTPRVCDDGNQCTIDVCNATTGCEFLPAPPCPGDGACMMGVCDPLTGCGLAPADDGTTCGTLQTCNAAQVCVSGSCVVRDPPDGYLCAEASPCQGEGHCVADVCVRPPPFTVLSPTWAFDSAATGDIDAGIPSTPYHDFVLEESGAATLSNFFMAPVRLRANTATPLEAPQGAARRCIIWGTRLVCADYPMAPNGHVSAMEFASGLMAWSYDVRAAHPEWQAITQQIFMARLVVQGSDRLAALFEAYPTANDGLSPTLCRAYFLVVLDASGHEVLAQRVLDPLLDVCTHPHPYGVVADSVGNLFIAFSPSVTAAAPLKPSNPTLLMSFTHDGAFRWKLTLASMTGGELAVARGLLYSENANEVVMAATGAPAFALPQTLGRVVISDTRLIPAPVTASATLTAYEAGTNLQRWTHALPPPMSFWSDQIRLASWQTPRGLRTVALTFVDLGGGQAAQGALRAINVHDGSEAFTCAVANLPKAPQLFELATGSMTVMAGAKDLGGNPACSKCDPPFAGSAAAFYTLPVTGLGVPMEPWIGTFGGPTHDHREEVPGPSVGN